MIQKLMNLKSKKLFYELLERNISNSLIQLGFHMYGTLEELQTYYGWEEPFTEPERVKLVEDTFKRLEAEKIQLDFYKNNQNQFNEIRKRLEEGSLGQFISEFNSQPIRSANSSEDAGEDGSRGSGNDQGGDGIHDNANEEGQSVSRGVDGIVESNPAGQDTPMGNSDGPKEDTRGEHEGGGPRSITPNW